MTDDLPAAGRVRLLPDGLEQVQLYHRDSVIERDIDLCRALGWKVVEFDTTAWADGDAMHDDLDRGLILPDYYGRNLDAFGEVSADLAAGRYIFDGEPPGGLIVLRRFDRLAAAASSRAVAIVDILVGACGRALEHGWPLALLLQSDDPNLTIPPVAAVTAGWNPSERTTAERTGNTSP